MSCVFNLFVAFRMDGLGGTANVLRIQSVRCFQDGRAGRNRVFIMYVAFRMDGLGGTANVLRIQSVRCFQDGRAGRNR